LGDAAIDDDADERAVGNGHGRERL
jgi:hypothetical protein